MSYTITKTSNQKEGGNQGRSSSSFYKQASSQPNSPRRGEEEKKKWRKPYYPSYRVPRIQKDAIDSLFNMARTFIALKDKEEQRMRKPHFPQK
ncbi:hypothetical protein O181_041493 [Austropuccinia psidii MF-1]|uniref:Uncharacterized protein n=1 Tax=Austropuccinia psidii MF-1 TaxID=1389203 RepID=A0A9Q3DJ97_9BASI|nr:hypothetical protein [Austropuccinia psidii MF-1]